MLRRSPKPGESETPNETPTSLGFEIGLEKGSAGGASNSQQENGAKEIAGTSRHHVDSSSPSRAKPSARNAKPHTLYALYPQS